MKISADKVPALQQLGFSLQDIQQMQDSLKQPSLRDQMAMATLQGLWGSPDMTGILRAVSESSSEIDQNAAMCMLAGIAYQQADAMIKAREVKL